MNLQNPLLLTAGLLLMAVYFICSWRLLTLLDKLGDHIPVPPPWMLTSRVTLAFMKIFKLDLKIDPKTKEERELISQITKTVVVARVLLIVAVLCFFAAYLLPIGISNFAS